MNTTSKTTTTHANTKPPELTPREHLDAFVGDLRAALAVMAYRFAQVDGEARDGIARDDAEAAAAFNSAIAAAELAIGEIEHVLPEAEGVAS